MTESLLERAYDFSGKTIAITGGAGVLCSALAAALAERGAAVALLDRDAAKADKEVRSLVGGLTRHSVHAVDVLDRRAIDDAFDAITRRHGAIDGLINGAGGNSPRATTNPEQAFFDIPTEAFEFVSNLNLLGTVVPCQVFGRHMALRREGVILNISSMNAFRPLTRIPAYSAAKAAVSNFTAWLAVHLAQEYSPTIRVNAIAPGFFLTDQNRFLLTERETGELTARGRRILEHTPMARFGSPSDLVGAALWLLSPASGFVTGAVIPIDGGFSAYSGV